MSCLHCYHRNDDSSDKNPVLVAAEFIQQKSSPCSGKLFETDSSRIRALMYILERACAVKTLIK